MDLQREGVPLDHGWSMNLTRDEEPVFGQDPGGYAAELLVLMKELASGSFEISDIEAEAESVRFQVNGTPQEIVFDEDRFGPDTLTRPAFRHFFDDVNAAVRSRGVLFQFLVVLVAPEKARLVMLSRSDLRRMFEEEGVITPIDMQALEAVGDPGSEHDEVIGGLRPLTAWSLLAHADLVASSQREAWAALLRHCAESRGKHKPTKKWLQRAAELIEPLGDELDELLIRWFLEFPILPSGFDAASVSTRELESTNGDILKGLAWACAHRGDSKRLQRALQALALAALSKVSWVGQRSAKVGNACLHAWATSADDDAIARLFHVRWRVFYATTIDIIDRILEELARDRGIGVTRLERNVARELRRVPDDAVVDEVAAIHELLDQGLDADALTKALALWRRCPTTDVARTVECLGRRVAPTKKKLQAEYKDQLATKWKDIAGSASPRDVTRLMDALGSFGRTDAVDMIPLLQGFRADPRISMGLAELAAVPKVQPRPEYWLALFNVLVTSQDPRTIDVLRDAVDSYERDFVREDHRVAMVSWARRAINALRARFPAGEPEITLKTQLEALRALRARVEPETVAPAARVKKATDFLAEIYENPGDLELRQIYADVASESGDPRGELIALQMLDVPNRQQRRRIRELIEMHAQEWLGPLTEVILKGGLVLRNGFPAEGALSTKSLAQCNRLIGSREWATFEKLSVRRARYTPAALWTDPSMRSLRDLDGLSFAHLIHILAHDRTLPLQRVGWDYRLGR